MFQHFSERATIVIMLAHEEAHLMKHDFVGIETILLGLISEGTGVASKLLKSKGVNLSDARIAVEQLVGLGSSDSIPHKSFTSSAFSALQLATEECDRDYYKHSVDTEHLLLGMLRSENTKAGNFLQYFGIELSVLRDEIINIIKQPDRGFLTVSSPTLQSLSPVDELTLSRIAELIENLSPAAKQQLAISLLAQNQNLL